VPSRIDDGRLLRVLAVAHAAVGLAFFRAEIRSIAGDGVLAAVPHRGPRATAFWFLVPSPLVWVIGRLVSRAEEAGDWEAVRRAHGASLASASLAAACMPVSGFWGWLAISARGLWRARGRG
jgi:hypothetical protein